ncbi:calcium/sodium antiporter [[Phormidium] sp. ETS-05]|uniref:calcium/sodium antiporter n=1 Tax=[Phormidium] sp. ETS-05 TaxID=222819 RepID=UPI001E6152F4|nr:calcium/sodium antiporter [[Phormidium] sp. ETS-05]
MELLIWIGVFIVSLAVLVKSSDYFTEAAEKIGLLLGMPSFIIGVTIVAVGTSLPELVSSIIAVQQNSSEIVLGNVVGSNIANIFLIIGLASVISKKMDIYYELIHVDLPLFVGSAFVLALTVYDGKFTIGEALICIACYLVYLLYTISSTDGSESEAESSESNKKPKGSLVNQIIIVAVSAIFLFFGADYTIESITKISEIINIGKELIAVTAVAVGTSLPELIVSVSAAKKGNPEIAVGNVLGSNIFNALMVMGIPALIGPLTLPANLLQLSVPVMLVATLLFFFVTQDKQVTQWEGWLFFLLYAWFTGNLFGFL